MTLAYVALGSNLGDRQAILQRAIQFLRAEPSIRLLCVSSFYETAPVGGPAKQGAYLNAATAIETDLPPDELLRRLLAIEEQLGRVRTVRDAPRTLDLDLLLYGELIREAPDPVVPHPRLHQRRFVLVPLAEIAPNIIHPALKRSIRELLESLPPQAEPDPRKYALTTDRAEERELSGLRALVTGSTTGIGRAIALEFARAGAAVIVHGRRSQEAADAVSNEAKRFAMESVAILADLSKPEECEQLPHRVWQFWGGIDVLVCCAGADVLTGEAARWSFERKWQELVAVDVTATMMLAREFGERMKSGRGGVILTIGWDQAETGMEGDTPQLHSAAKAAVMAFTRSLALSLAPKVRVNCIAPGWIRTAWGETASMEWQERVRRETPLQRWGLPEDVAAAARWLVSPTAAFVTGQTIRINGGAIR